MTDTDELRRLAEEALATEDDPAITVDPQAILALLDAERDLRNERDDLAMRNSGLEYSAYAWKGQAAAAERRVAALEEGLRDIKKNGGKVCDEYEICEHVACQSSYYSWATADRALLAADPGVSSSTPAPSEPLRLGQQVAIESHLPRDLQEQADAIRDPAALPAAPSKPLSEDELRWPFPIADDWTWQGDGPPGQHHGAGDGWAHLHSDGSRWVHPEKVCPAALPAEDDSVAAQALIDSWGGTEDQWGNFYPHEPVSEASDE